MQPVQLNQLSLMEPLSAHIQAKRIECLVHNTNITQWVIENLDKPEAAIVTNLTNRIVELLEPKELLIFTYTKTTAVVDIAVAVELINECYSIMEQ